MAKRNDPNSLTVHSRVAVRSFATIASAYSKRGLTTQSAIVAKALDDYATLLIERKLAPAYQNAEEACEMLAQLEVISREQRSGLLRALLSDKDADMPFVPQQEGVAELSVAEKIAASLAAKKAQD